RERGHRILHNLRSRLRWRKIESLSMSRRRCRGMPRGPKEKGGGGMTLRRAAFAFALPVVLIGSAVVAAGVGATSNSAKLGAGTASAKTAGCGLGNGKQASGAPIKLGTINMLIPGVDFTTIAKIANAYFKCVNDNGGIHGRPIKYIQYTEQLNPAQQATLARKLVESDKVVGIVGNTSFT